MRLAAAALIAATSVAAVPLVARQVTCVDGLYVIVARGSGEPEGEGELSEVADMITSAVPNSESVAVAYPATIFSDPTYPTSVNDGINNAISEIQSYVNQCGSGSQIALLGYSQGGNVMTDVLAGGVDKPAPLAAPYTDNIVGVAVFGDPTYTTGQSFDAGNATRDGLFSRGGSSLALLNDYASITQSYCMVHDPVCATGDDIDVHYAEVSTFAQAAADFIVGLVQ